MRKACAAVATLGVLMLAACTGEEPPPDTDPSSPITAEPTTEATEPSPTESSSEPTEPVEPTPPAVLEGKPSERAAIAFVEHYWDAVNFAQATGDTALLKSLQGEFCNNCSNGANWIADVRRAGGRIEGGDHVVDISSAMQAPTGPDGWIVAGHVTQDSGRVVEAGDLNQKIARDDYGVVFTLIWRPSGWEVSSWDISRA